MYDAKVMHAPSAKFVYEVVCPNPDCRRDFRMVSLSHGIRCPFCGVHDPSHKTYRRLVKP